MFKSIFVLFICLFVFEAAFAQKKDTTVYFVKNNGMFVSERDSADYMMLIISPDTSIDKNLFSVKGYYLNGKVKFITGSMSSSDIKFQGPYTSFFPNGRRHKNEVYENGKVNGNVIEYYPNGKLYSLIKYKDGEKIFLSDCRDSIGNVLAQDGNGKWMKFNSDFTKLTDLGQIVNGVEEGEWRSRISDSVDLVNNYKNGKLVSSDYENKYEKKVYTSVEKVPEFPGGLKAFGNFLSSNLKYPETARVNRVQGIVNVIFVVEKDGTLTDIKIMRGIGSGCDEEAVRVIKLSPKWTPGIQNGKPIRIAYGVPIYFSLN